jgi:hypothetical protein
VNLRRLPEADSFAMLTFKPQVCLEQRIPVADYPIRRLALEAALDTGQELSVSDLIRGLMEWLDVTDDPEPATGTLLQLLGLHHPPGGRPAASCEFADEDGVRRRFCLGEVDCDSALIAWQRGQRVMAFAQPGIVEPGRMVVAAPRPISARVAETIVSHSLITYMLEPHDAYASAKHSAGRNANFYALDAGATAIIPWDHGYGRSERAGTVGADDGAQSLPSPCDWLAPNQLAMMIAIGSRYA